MHNNFLVVDGRIVWTGSANILDSGTEGYYAIAVVVLHSAAAASVYTREFERLRNANAQACTKKSDGAESFQLNKVIAFCHL